MIEKIKILFFVFNFIVYFINIYFLVTKIKNEIITKFMNKGDINLFLNNFRNVDKFIFYTVSKSYVNIANLINKNYNIKSDNKNIRKKRRKLIKVYGVDLVGSVQRIKKKMKTFFQNKYIIHLDKNSPDYLIYNVFGNENLKDKYKNSIKIAYLSENCIPDFFKCDYAIGHSNIIYFDRFFKLPDCLVWPLAKIKKDMNISAIKQKAINNLKNKKFCAAVISNVRSSDLFRIKFIEELNKYKKVDCGGMYHNNIKGAVKNKTKFLSNYKFSIAMENSNGDGYISEKIIDSFKAGTIPIYYGGYMVDEYINPKSFILIKGEKDMRAKIEYIKKIDNDDELYKKILMEDVINKEKFENANMVDFFDHIFRQDKGKAKRY